MKKISTIRDRTDQRVHMWNARRIEEEVGACSDRAIAKWFLAGAYLEQSRHDEALSLLRKAIDRHGRLPSLLSQLAMVSGRAGRRQDAVRLIDELLAISRREYVSPALLAMALVGLGDRDRAFAWFERAYEERSNLMIYFTIHPSLDPLRNDPRYADLAARIRRPHKLRGIPRLLRRRRRGRSRHRRPLRQQGAPGMHFPAA